MNQRRVSIASLFVACILMTEFFYVSIGPGVVRIGQVAAPVLLCAIMSVTWRKPGGALTWAILAYMAWNVIACVLSDKPYGAFASLSGHLANWCIAFLVAVWLLAGRLSAASLTVLITKITVASVAWSVVQVIASRVGINLGMSWEQESQIAIGFGPAFRTEANTFGKYLTVAILFCLPEFLARQAHWRVRLCACIFAIGFLLNFTRTAVYGLLVGLCFVVAWYAAQARGLLVGRAVVRLVPMLATGVVVAVLGLVPVSSYALFKMQNLFDEGELLEGSSSGYRILAMRAVLERAGSGVKPALVGNGWGQTHVDVQGVVIQAGGGDAVNILGYSGAIGVAAYCVYTALAILVAVRVSWRRRGSSLGRFGESVMFALVGSCVTGQMSSYLITPEYYVLLGAALFLATPVGSSGGRREEL